jgi:DNA-binding NarL/FixJ family response regulator
MSSSASTLADVQTPYRVLLVAQSPVLRFGIRTVLESAVSLETVTEAAGVLEAVAQSRAGQTDFVVIHDALPGVTGTVAAGMLRRLFPQARIVLMSDDVDERHRAEALRAGVDNLLSMAIDPDDFLATMNGLIESSSSSAEDRLVPDAPATPSLPAPQLAVLDGIVRGLATDDIARRLRMDVDAVVSETDVLLAHLGVIDRPSIVTAAIRLGLVDLSDQLPPPAYTPEIGIEASA